MRQDWAVQYSSKRSATLRYVELLCETTQFFNSETSLVSGKPWTEQCKLLK